MINFKEIRQKKQEFYFLTAFNRASNFPLSKLKGIIFNGNLGLNRLLFIFLMSLFLIPPAVRAQTEQENFDKYWHYRQRFNQYFMYVGDKEGESMVVCARNREFTSQLCFGQHGIHFGYYLGVLATEYLILVQEKQHQKAKNTLKELRSALTAYEEQMDKCEQYWGKEKCLDGFFVRENMPLDYLDTNTENGKNHFEALNKGLTSANIWNSDSACMLGLANGQPAWVNGLFEITTHKEPMSQDEAYGVMMGLALIIKCVPPLAEEAKYLFELICLHIIGKNECQNCGGEGYVIKKPDCNSISESTGGVTAFFGYGIACAAAKFTDKNIDYYYNTFDAKKLSSSVNSYFKTGKLKLTIGNNNMYMLWDICKRGIPGTQEWNRSMVSTLAALGDSWGEKTDKGLINNAYWKKGEKTHDWRSFYLSLWRFLHDKNPDNEEKKLIKSELDAAPYEGPYNLKTENNPNNIASGGWAYTYRYRATIKEQFEGGPSTGIFNGLDYMLMYNLYQLIYIKR